MKDYTTKEQRLARRETGADNADIKLFLLLVTVFIGFLSHS